MDFFVFDFPFWARDYKEVNDLDFNHHFIFFVEIFHGFPKFHFILDRLKFFILFMVKVVKALCEIKGVRFEFGISVSMPDKFDNGGKIIKTWEVCKYFGKGLFSFLVVADEFIVEADFIKKPENIFLAVGFCVSLVLLEGVDEVEYVVL